MHTYAVAACLSAVLLAAYAPAVTGQADYPSRRIELVVPFPPGGPNDTAARLIQPHLSAALNVPVPVVNKGGGGGAVGAEYVLAAGADGYTLFFTTNTTLTILPHTNPEVKHRLGDFVAVASATADYGAVTVRSDAPWKTLEAMVEDARKNPGKLSYGSAGVGTLSSFAMEILKMSQGVNIVHVPYQGTGPVKTAILGNHVNLVSSGFSSLGPLIKSGDLVALFTTAPTRIKEYPDVPTAAEKGIPDATLNLWVLLAAPAKTPKHIVDTLGRAMEKTMKDPQVVAAVEKAGMAVDFHGPPETQRMVEKESEVVRNAAQKMGLGKK
jgi:tripartite-type tricarboxylate transporter receptor subunit TctC